MAKKLNLSAQEISSLYPISGVNIYKRALVLVRHSNQDWVGGMSRVTRGTVVRLSARSRTNFVLRVMTSRIEFQSLLILSYGRDYPKTGKKVKADLNRFLMALKRRYGGVKYFWFLEFQRRGAPHFNLGLTVSSPTREDRVAVAKQWARAIGASDFDNVVAVNSHPKQWENFREEGSALRYIIKYATKPHQKLVPKDYQDVGRFWGMSRVQDREEPLVLWGNEADVRELCSELGRDFDGWELLPRVVFF